MTTKSQSKVKQRGLKWWLGRVSIAVLIIISSCIAYLLIVGASAKSKLLAENPAPGRLVDVGGYNMHINCMGEGSPTVIMDAGAGDFSVTWSAVQPQISQTTRVCTYDRSGFGWSDRNPESPRTSETIVKELDTLLVNANIDGSYVLVGHSFGGMNVRLFAERYPEKVAGMVLVDSLSENQSLETQAINRQVYDHVLNEFGVISVLQSLGLLALSPEEIPNQGLSDKSLHQYRSVLASTTHIETMIEEMGALEQSIEQVRKEKITSLSGIPLVVLSAEHDDFPFLTEDQNGQLAQAWNAKQLELVALSTNSRHVMVSNSGHYIQLDQPQRVINAIENIVNQIN